MYKLPLRFKNCIFSIKNIRMNYTSILGWKHLDAAVPQHENLPTCGYWVSSHRCIPISYKVLTSYMSVAVHLQLHKILAR